MSATLSKRTQRRCVSDPTVAVSNWHRDPELFEFMVTDSENHEYVKWSEYWSTWATDSDEVNARSREHVKSARHWEDMQVAESNQPTGYWLYPAGLPQCARWVAPPSNEPVTQRATEASAAARTKSDVPMTGSQRKALSKWRQRATKREWTCPTHSDPTLTDCGLTCREQYDTDREQQVKATLGHMDLTQK